MIASTAPEQMTIDADPSDLAARAACLINPASGIANDFLNHYNEILLMVENLPVLLPEMVDELMQWRPTTYVEYFQKSPLPGGRYALARYEQIDPAVRLPFEELVEQLNAKAVEIVAKISAHRRADGSIEADEVAGFCAAASEDLRTLLDAAAAFVNFGATAS
jgi:hypothetical protein